MMAALPPMHCTIEHQDKGGMTTVVPTIVGGGRTQGTFQFEIISSSGGNRSSNSQGGDFEKTDSGRLALSRSTISKGGWTARLTVYGPDGEKLCTVSVP
ncbi:curli-like amyloid fiber formation chaperone CsgH [Rhizobium sp. Root1220]|uniref:curli-like amyloid fiber formation chaperone CsgH n=1 Tax=Rhizobium sp. Root1220 TaxID=1736432 RepID=UPI0006F6898B|nr:curli-like amyloid fiber formation chaperone CsgH [Rhizobium sp. Root1220]KQV65340.1 hypothetical protein ASC90_15845 [Rhizobium sp. Root1220]